MLQGVLFSIVLLVVSAWAECDVSSLSDPEKTVELRLCHLENEISVVQRALQEVMQQTDTTLFDQTVPIVNKRKNEFIRFGKRGFGMEKRKNEFIRFGKRKNEFIRFGRSNGGNEQFMNKRKNEFIRFG